MTDSPKENDSSQVNRFWDAARELGCDDDEAAFDEKLAKIARHKPAQKPLPLGKPDPATEQLPRLYWRMNQPPELTGFLALAMT